MKSAWTFALARLAGALAFAVVGGLVFGRVDLWLVGVLAGYLLLQFANLYRLHRWLKHRKEEDPPDLGGVWGDVVALVGRIYRRKNFHKRRIAQLLREFRRLTAAMPEGVILLSPEREIIWFNRTGAQLLGLRRKLDFGMRIENLIRQPEFTRYLESGPQASPVVVRYGPASDRFLTCQLIQAGEVTRGYLGILIQQLTPELAQSFGLGQAQGILVAQVTPGSPAAAAGLRQGDVIIGHQGETVTDVGAFRNRIALTPPGGQALISILRNGQTLEVPVTIGTLTEEALAASGPSQGQALEADALGLKVQTLTPQLAEQFDVAVGEGVVVTTVKSGSVAAQAGIEPGTLILQVNQQPVKDAASFKQAIEHSPDKRALLLLRKGSRQQFLVLNWR